MTKRRITQLWLLIAVVGIQIGIVALSIALASQMPAIANGLSGAATLILAGLTVLILVYNAGVLNATQQSASATRDEAEATRDEARATREQAQATMRQAEIATQSLEELRRTRELDAQPVIVRLEGSMRVAQGRVVRDVAITNIGRGPALNCTYVRAAESADGNFMRTALFDLGVGHRIELPAEPVESMEANPLSLLGEKVEAIFCQDQLGNTIRFLPGTPRPEVFSRVHADGSAMPPDWTAEYFQLLNYRQPEVPLPPGPAFVEATHVLGNYSECHTAVVWEAVPALDLGLAEYDVDVIQEWVNTLEPRAKRASADLARWAYQPEGAVNEQFWVRASPGPCVCAGAVLDLQSELADSGSGLTASLPLVDLSTKWQVYMISGRRLAQALGVRRIRYGLTLIMSGSHDTPRLQDVDFGILQKPPQKATPSYYVRHFSNSSAPMDLGDWPEDFLKLSIREVLRRFGYRATDELISSLPFGRPPS